MGYKTYTCPIARSCGGCEWLAVPYPIQLRRKQELVEGLLGGMAREDGCSVGAIRGMDEPVAYRHKAATPFAPGKGGRVRSGFYSAGTHRIVACGSCLVEDPRARGILEDVARVAQELGIRPYQEDRGRGALRHAVVRCGYATDDVLLTVVANGQRLPREEEFVHRMAQLHPEVTSIVLNVNQRRTNAILGRECRTLMGPGTMEDALLGCTFRIGPTSFYQTNPRQTEVLYQLAIDGARLRDGMRVLDAYCGCGTIGICAASRARTASAGVAVVGVEQVAGAVRMARGNARANALADSCEFVRADATAYMEGVARGSRRRVRRCGDGPAARGLHAGVPGGRGAPRPQPRGLRQLQREDAGTGPRTSPPARLCDGVRGARGHVPAHEARGKRRHARSALAAPRAAGTCQPLGPAWRLHHYCDDLPRGHCPCPRKVPACLRSRPRGRYLAVRT